MARSCYLALHNRDIRNIIIVAYSCQYGHPHYHHRQQHHHKGREASPVATYNAMMFPYFGDSHSVTEIPGPCHFLRFF